MIGIKFKANEQVQDFDSYYDVVSHMRRNSIPWEQVKAQTNMDYKKKVRKRVRIAYGLDAATKLRVLSDKDFIMDLFNLGEIMEISEK